MDPNTPANSPATPPAEPPAAPPEERPIFVAKTQRDLDKKFGAEKKAAAQAERQALLERYELSSEDELDAIIGAHRTAKAELETETDREREARQKAEKSVETLKGERQTLTQERDALQEKVGRYEEALNSYVEAEMEGVEDHIKELLEGRDPVDQLAYLTKNREAVKGGNGARVNRNVGRASTVGAGANGAENARGRDRLANAFGRKYG